MSCRSSPSSLHSCRPSPPIAIVLSVHCRRPPHSHRPLPSWRCCAVHCRREAVALSLFVEEPSHHPLPSRIRHAAPCCQGSVGRVDGPPSHWSESSPTSATRHAPPRPLVWLVVALPLLTPPPPICRCLSLRHRLSCLLSG